MLVQPTQLVLTVRSLFCCKKRILSKIYINCKQKLYFTSQNYLFYLARGRGQNFWFTSWRNCLDPNEGTLSGFLHADLYLLYQQHCGTLRKAQILQVSFLESAYQKSLLQAYEKERQSSIDCLETGKSKFYTQDKRKVQGINKINTLIKFRIMIGFPYLFARFMKWSLVAL